MSFSFSKEAIDDLKSQIDIVDVVGRSVQLKRAGANYKGNCPFHNEKTPSFVVSPQKQIYTCFGCGASGNAISFVMQYYNLAFNEAVEKLAGEYGITLQKNTRNDDREKYYEINREAARFFYKSLTESKNPGYTYMQKRGISDQIIKKFGLGYADGNWDSLYKHFKAKGVSEKLLVELGLLSEKDGRYYDKFRDRVIFPIINTSGKVIGFGGRALSNEVMPKYLNSPENKVFQKKNNLYALNITRQDVGKEGHAIIVEGYMDVISLYQNGVRNVAASLGTALTENQAKLINRYTKNIVLSYDADAAGQKAALRGIDVLRQENCKVKVLHVTDGKDPDEFIKKNGREAFVNLVNNAMPYIDYKLEAYKKGLNLATEEGKLDYMKRITQVLKELGPVEADLYIKKIAKNIGIAEGAIKMEISGDNIETKEIPRPALRPDNDEMPLDISSLEATLLKCIFTEPHLVEQMLGQEEIFRGYLSKKIINIIYELYGLYNDFNVGQVNDRLEPKESEELELALDKVVVCGNADEVLNDCINSWQINSLQRQERKLLNMLSLADEETNDDSVRELTIKLMEIQNKIKVFGGNK
ncbi:MAG: DNA primase [Firmicutes bacterium]|nr:DNA primase [Bacillota bacterium]